MRRCGQSTPLPRLTRVVVFVGAAAAGERAVREAGAGLRCVDSKAKVVMENGLAKLEIIVDAVTGLPRVFAVEAWIEFCIGMMTGDVEKGGCRELRANTELYATALHGRSQAEVQMPLEKKGKFGWGPYKDDPFKLQSIQQYATALRIWVKEELAGCGRSSSW